MNAPGFLRLHLRIVPENDILDEKKKEVRCDHLPIMCPDVLHTWRLTDYESFTLGGIVWKIGNAILSLTVLIC